MTLRLDLKIFILFILFYFTKQIEIYATIMIFAIIHELGHLLAGLLFGMKPQRLQINPFGVSIDFNTSTKDYNKKIRKGNYLEIKKMIIAFAGPLTNLLLIIFLFFIPLSYDKKLIYIYSNIVLIAVNILPIYPLDGGRILKEILHIYLGKYKSLKYINNISFIVTAVLTVIASIAILYIENIAIFLCILYLWILVFRENARLKTAEKLYKQIEILEKAESV